MNKLLTKRVVDLTVLELLESSHLNYLAQSLSIGIDDFCKFTGRSKRHVYQQLHNRTLPESLVVGGYGESKRGRKILFVTSEVIIWLKKNSLTLKQ